MAINIDTVYQRVLAIANKEQRGYINPQQFNLFANQVQLDIFEDYFFKLSQLEFSQKNNSQYNDLKKLVQEKIQPFEKRHIQVTVTSPYDSYLPADVYRLGEVIWTGNGSYPGDKIIEEVTEKQLIEIHNSPLAKPTQNRPIFVRRGAIGEGLGSLLRIFPASTTESHQVALFFTIEVDTSSSTSAEIQDPIDWVEVGQTVTGSGIPIGTTVVSVATGPGGLVLSKAALTTESNNPLTFASDDIKCNYIRKPNDVSWGYTEINSTALYNSASSIDFELHGSEENTLVIKILALAGVSIKDQELAQFGMAKEQQTK